MKLVIVIQDGVFEKVISDDSDVSVAVVVHHRVGTRHDLEPSPLGSEYGCHMWPAEINVNPLAVHTVFGELK